MVLSRAMRASLSALHRASRRMLHSHHLKAILAFLVITWGVRFGSFEGWTTGSYAGNLAEDAGQFIWFFQHLWRVVLGQTDLFFSDRVFYPVGLQMVRQDWAPTAALLALPFQPVGPLFALNMEVLIAFVLCGYFTYLLANQLCRDRLLAFMAGVIFAFCEFRVDKSFGHINQANQQFIPLYLYFLVRFFDDGRFRHIVGAAVSFYLATFCTYYQLVFVVLLTLLIVAFRAGRSLGAAGLRPRAWPRALAGWGRETLTLGVVFGLASLPLFGPLLFNFWESFVQAASALTLTMPEYSADLYAYVLSNLYTPPPERLFSGEGGTAFLGYGLFVLFLFSLVLCRRSGAGLWIFMALVFFVVSLGSTLVIAGKPIGRLPVFDILQALPIVKGAKVAARFASLVILCAALASVVTLAHAERRFLAGTSSGTRQFLKGLLVVLVCAETLIPPARYVQASLPVPFDVPSVYRAVAQEPGDAALLQFPPCWDAFTGNIGPHRFPRQLFAYQTVHGKPIFSGIGNMVPATTLRYLLRLPLVGDLTRIGTGQPLERSLEDPVRRRADGTYVAATLDLRLVQLFKVMTIPGGDRVPERYSDALAYLHQNLHASLVHEDGELMLLGVHLPSWAGEQGEQTLTFRERGSLVHLGGAWSRTERDGRFLAEASLDSHEDKELYLRLARGLPTTIHLTMRCSLAPCAVRVLLNEQPVGELSLGPEMSTQPVRLDGQGLQPGLNRLKLVPAGSATHKALPVGRTGGASPRGLLVRSAGVEVGDEAAVLMEGQHLTPNTRGYNLAVLDATGDVLAATAFDLVADTDGRIGAQLVRFIDDLPTGAVVALAVRDDGSIGLTPTVAAALGRLGAARPPVGKLRHSYALIGVKGAPPGTAMERLSAMPVELELGRRLELHMLRVEAAATGPAVN